MIHCGLVMAKSRITPIKFVSIPRLELAAVSLSIKGLVILRKELTIHSKFKEYFWTDSQVVLSYINSNSKRFKIFVANSVQIIQQFSDVSQWINIDSTLTSLIRQMIHPVVYLHHQMCNLQKAQRKGW